MPLTGPRYSHARRLAQRKIAGEIFVVDPANKCLHQPQGVAESIWEWLAKGATEGELVQAVLREYDVDPGTAGRDVRRFVRELVRKRLVEEVPLAHE